MLLFWLHRNSPNKQLLFTARQRLTENIMYHYSAHLMTKVMCPKLKWEFSSSFPSHCESNDIIMTINETLQHMCFIIDYKIAQLYFFIVLGSAVTASCDNANKMLFPFHICAGSLSQPVSPVCHWCWRWWLACGWDPIPVKSFRCDESLNHTVNRSVAVC